jgi:hypothetical protein
MKTPIKVPLSEAQFKLIRKAIHRLMLDHGTVAEQEDLSALAVYLTLYENGDPPCSKCGVNRRMAGKSWCHPCEHKRSVSRHRG